MPKQRKTNFDFGRLFKDEKAFSDELTIKVGEADIPLGDLRAYNEQVGGDLVAELERQRQAVQADQVKVQQASEALSKMFIDFESQKKVLEGQQRQQSSSSSGDPLEPYSEDPIFKPVIAHMKAMESKYTADIKAATDKLDLAVKSIAQMGSTYMGDKAATDYAAIMAKDDPVRPKDITLDSLYKIAVEQRIYDRNNLPDLKTTYERITAPARHTYEVAEAEKRGHEAALREIQEGAMLPRPASGLPALPEGFKPPRNLNDAISQAGHDRDLFREIMSASNPILGGSIQ